MAVTRAVFKTLAKNFTDNVFADFTKEFTIQNYAALPDGQGGQKLTWLTFAIVRGFVKDTDGMQRTKDGYIKSEYKTKFSFEYVDGVTNKMRILYKDNIYNIDSNIPILEADVFINIMAKEEVAT
jgi:SPP1 family predicted phage head-tail adaptor